MGSQGAVAVGPSALEEAREAEHRGAPGWGLWAGTAFVYSLSLRRVLALCVQYVRKTGEPWCRCWSKGSYIGLCWLVLDQCLSISISLPGTSSILARTDSSESS